MLLESEGFRVQHVASQEALAAVRQSQFGLILLDFAVPDYTEIEIRAIVDENTRVVRLGEFTFPGELLHLVGRRT